MTENQRTLFNYIKKAKSELLKNGMNEGDIETNVMSILNKYRNEINSNNVFNSMKYIGKLVGPWY
jgi:hypothetical protein